MGIWAIRNPLKIHCYTCMSSETCWSRLIYTKLSSHRSFVINMYVITMAWRCISPWSFYRSLQRRKEMDIFHICQQISAFWSKNNQKKGKTSIERSLTQKSADPHETILTAVICGNHVRCHDGVTLYFSMKFPSVTPKKTRNGHFSIYQQISAHFK